MKARLLPTSCGKLPKCGANADERHLHSVVAGTEALRALTRTDRGLARPATALSPGARLRPGAGLSESRQWKLSAICCARRDRQNSRRSDSSGDSGHAYLGGLPGGWLSAGALVAFPPGISLHGTHRHRLRGLGDGIWLDRSGHAGLSTDHELHGPSHFLPLGSAVSADQSSQAPGNHHPTRSAHLWRGRVARSPHQCIAFRLGTGRFPALRHRRCFSLPRRIFVFQNSVIDRQPGRSSAPMVRTRSTQAHEKVLEATLALFERGIDTTSMDAIAEKSGVSKATIYKHWPDKDALALEALSLVFGLDEVAPRFDSGDLRQDLVDALTYQPSPERQEMKNRMMPHVMAYAARNRKFGEQWRTRVIERPQTRLKDLLQRGIEHRQLVSKINLDTGLALLLGPMIYWHIFVGKKSLTPMPKDLATEVVSAFWKVYGRESFEKPAGVREE